MRKAKVMALLIVILFILAAVSIASGYYFYEDYKGKIDYLEKQNQSAKEKLESFGKSIDDLNGNVEGLTGQFKKYSEELVAMKDKVSLGAAEKNEMLSKISSITNDMENLNAFSATVNELKEKVETLRNKLENAKTETHKVDLGKISVEKPEGTQAQ